MFETARRHRDLEDWEVRTPADPRAPTVATRQRVAAAKVRAANSQEAAAQPGKGRGKNKDTGKNKGWWQGHGEAEAKGKGKSTGWWQGKGEAEAQPGGKAEGRGKDKGDGQVSPWLGYGQRQRAWLRGYGEAQPSSSSGKAQPSKGKGLTFQEYLERMHEEERRDEELGREWQREQDRQERREEQERRDEELRAERRREEEQRREEARRGTIEGNADRLRHKMVRISCSALGLSCPWERREEGQIRDGRCRFDRSFEELWDHEDVRGSALGPVVERYSFEAVITIDRRAVRFR